MEEFVKLVEQILYMENFNTAVTPELKQKFIELNKTYGNNVPDKYKADVNRLYNNFRDKQSVEVDNNAYAVSY
ncbi:hypothetical protein RCZ04_04670 [Capnocytophaga sp. HP1101]